MLLELTDGQRTKIEKLRRRGKSSEEIAQKLRLDQTAVAAVLAHVTRRKEMKKIKKKLLVVECTSELKEDMSESSLLTEWIRILDPASMKLLRIEKVQGRRGFIRELKNADELFIHISAHGKYHKGKRVRGTRVYFTSGKYVNAYDFKQIWADRSSSKKPKLVVLSACAAGHQDMAKALYEAGCRYFVAPVGDPYWWNAALFLTIFYRLLLKEDHTPWVAFKKTDYALRQILPRLTGAWSFYDRGQKVLYEE